jgi:hypothetical protein
MKAGATIARVAGVLLLILGFAAPSAWALGGSPFQVLLNRDGSGRIFMNDGQVPSWNVCRADLTGCAPFATSGDFSTGSAPSGSVFSAGSDLRTPVWRGNVHPASPPSIEGQLRPGSVVVPVRATWEGGWEDDYDIVDMAFCRTPTGEECVQVNHEASAFEGNPRKETLIDPVFAGWYLEVFDERYGSGTAFAGVGHDLYYPIEKVQPGPTIAVAVVGRVAPLNGSGGQGPRGLFKASILRDGSAKVRCLVSACKVTLIARRGSASARVARTIQPLLSPNGQSASLRLPPASLERLLGGRIDVTVMVDGSVADRRAVRLGPLPVLAAYPEQRPRDR